MIKKLTLLSTAILVLQILSVAQNDSRNLKDLAAGCLPASAYAELNINNVRARINNGGDMWWDLTSNSEYEIPEGSGRTSMFAGAIWIGGLDNNNQIRLAAQRYRGNGNDFFPGPLSTDGSASIEDGECIKYDVIHTLYKKDVEQFVTWFENPNAYPGYIIPQYFFDYPAHGDLSKGQSFYLAPFFDNNSDGQYNPYDGDYPYYDLSNALCRSNFPTQEEISGYVSGNSNLADQVLKGDQTLWWVFNDKGNAHTETQGQSIGIEIRAQAYAYQSHDEINNATFYSYEIINRSPNKLSETFIGFFIDPDLGGSKDDYIGSDVLRGLGYCYNGDSYDDDADGAFGYGINPPAIGVDFFQGPYMDADGIDNPEFRMYSDSSGSTIIENCNEAINGQNFGNGIVDDERYGMAHFVYFNGTGTVPWVMTQPEISVEYYNFMRSIYKDNTHMIYGGNGSTFSGGYGPDCNFMFPGESDPCDYNTGGIAPNGPRLWTETTAGNQPYDRRFLVSTGPFSLEAGEVNYVTVGVPWGRSLCGGPEASIDMLRIADDKIQRLFDNCFYIMSGPDAPNLTIQEMDQEVILFLSNNVGNNLNENYSEIDPSIVSPDSLPSDQRYDSLFRFEGYQVFQLKDATVTADDLDNSDLARLVAQCDIKNSVSQILNYEYSADLGALVPIEKVDGENAGIIHSFRLFHDLFSPGNSRLINNKKYYYMVVAYAFNEYVKYSPDPAWQFPGEASLYGQQTPYLRSKKNMGVYTAIPHIPIVENDGTISNADYGDEPKITRIEGQGNGGHIIDLVSTSISDIFDNNFSPELTYINGFGPITVKVVDPLNVVNANYILRFDTLDYNVDTANWILEQYDASMNLIQTFASDHDISYYNEQVFPELGISITICQSLSPGDITHVSNGFLDASIGYPNSSGTWLSGVADVDGNNAYNWIRSGMTEEDGSGYGDYAGIDPGQDYEKILGGTWAPYRLCASHADSPVPSSVANFIGMNEMSNLASVDIVFTPDKSKWSRCPVIESCDDNLLSEGGVEKGSLRAGASVDKDGITGTAQATYDGYATGMGWFPGYAINIETGERLNLAFAEDSWMVGENGRDMILNPSSNFETLTQYIFGGKHFIYVFGHNYDGVNSCPAYDEGKWLHDIITAGGQVNLRNAYKDVLWVGIPMLAPNQTWLSSDVHIRLRVSKPYAKYYSTDSSAVSNPQNANYPMYSFSMSEFVSETNDLLTAQSALSLINIVPNPYYDYNGYSENQTERRVKITNLPENCTVSIYSINGKLIRKLEKTDGFITYLEWDLKNTAGNLVNGGVYLIHVNAPGIGERTLKWYCSMMPLDINAF